MNEDKPPQIMSNSRARSPLALVHTDLCGPLSSTSISGSRYILTITDGFSRYTWFFFLKRKSETLARFRQFKTMIEVQFNFKLKAVRSDRGGEYTSHDFVKFCEDSGIARQLTQAHTPHQNGVAERKNRSLLEKARCMAFEYSLPAFLWTEAVSTANYLINRTSTRANGYETPYERLTGNKPTESHLKVFGCRTYVQDTSPARKKWAPRSSECIFVGYDLTSRGFRNYSRSMRKIIVAKDVDFDKGFFPCSLPSDQHSKPKELVEWPTSESHDIGNQFPLPSSHLPDLP